MTVSGPVYSHRDVFCCRRTKKPTIFRATEQWFASVEGFRKEALAAIDEVSSWGLLFFGQFYLCINADVHMLRYASPSS